MVYIITGSTSGLGLQIAIQLCKKDKVIGISRSMNIPHELLEFTLTYKHYAIDLSEGACKVRKLFNELLLTIDACEKITLVINAAKFQVSDMVLDPEESTELFNTNFFNATVLVKSLISKQLRRVLFINSISGLVAQPNQFDYSASKHALNAFSDALAITGKKSYFDG